MKKNEENVSISLNTDKEKYGIVSGNPEQITNMVETYFRARAEPEKGIEDEIQGTFYSTQFSLAERTVNGEMIDMLAPLYLTGTVLNGVSTFFNYEPASDLAYEFNAWIDNLDNTKAKITFYAEGVLVSEHKDAYHKKCGN